MNKSYKLIFETELQLKIFFKIINNPKGIIRDTIAKDLNISRTTIYDNLKKLEKRTIITEKNLSIPYIRNYTVSLHSGKGRPCVLWYVPKFITKKFMEITMPTTEVCNKK